MKDNNALPNREEMMKDLRERFAEDLKLFDSVQVILVKDDKGIGRASMQHEDILFMQEAFNQDLPDVLANLMMAIKEQIKNKDGKN